MAKVLQNDEVLDRSGGRNFRLWPAFRRKILDTMRCGGSQHRRNKEGGAISSPIQKPTLKQTDLERKGGSETLSEILNLSVTLETRVVEAEVETKRNAEVFDEFQGVFKRLQSEEGLLQKEAALDVRRLAKEDSEARSTLAMLGVIPLLVAMLDSNDQDIQIASLYALLNLGIGNDMNKAAIVKAGSVHKMLKLIDESPTSSVSEAIVANLLGLSALDANKPIIGSSGAIPFLVKTLQNVDNNKSGLQEREDSLRALYNLSISSSNINQILETNLVSYLLSIVGDMKLSERVLSILSNVVSWPEGRKAISDSPEAFPILIDVLNWIDSPTCQEKACYILMVMAHKAYGDRQAMIEAGIVSSLLELTLLGSTLAQKRASRILGCLRIDKGKHVPEGYGAAVSAPICGSSSSSAGPSRLKETSDEEEDKMMSEEKKAVKQLVQQSLQNNMRRIVKRANLIHDFVPSDHFKSLTSTSTSKSLPF